MQLCDKDILKCIENGDLVIATRYTAYPFENFQVQPGSIDIRLGNRIALFQPDTYFDTKNIDDLASYLTTREYGDKEDIILKARGIIFAETYENIKINANLSARVFGRNRYVRMGISVHSAGGYINPGYCGTIPLQIINNNDFPIKIHPFESICQIVLYCLSSNPKHSYMDRENTAWRENLYESYDLVDMDHAEIEDIKNVLNEQYKKNVERNLEAKELEKVFTEGIHMGDTYNIHNAAMVGRNVGKKANINQTINNNSVETLDLQKTKEEIIKLREYIEKTYTNLDMKVIVNDLKTAENCCDENNEQGVKERLKLGGNFLLDTARAIGCGILSNLISTILGI